MSRSGSSGSSGSENIMDLVQNKFAKWVALNVSTLKCGLEFLILIAQFKGQN